MGTRKLLSKQADEALRESEERYRTLFEHSPIPTWVEDFSDVKLLFDEVRGQGRRAAW